MTLTFESKNGEEAFWEWNNSDEANHSDYSPEQLFAAGYERGAREAAKLRAILSRCAEHLISGSDIAESPLPTMEEIQEALGIK